MKAPERPGLAGAIPIIDFGGAFTLCSRFVKADRAVGPGTLQRRQEGRLVWVAVRKTVDDFNHAAGQFGGLSESSTANRALAVKKNPTAAPTALPYFSFASSTALPYMA